MKSVLINLNVFNIITSTINTITMVYLLYERLHRGGRDGIFSRSKNSIKSLQNFKDSVGNDAFELLKLRQNELFFYKVTKIKANASNIQLYIDFYNFMKDSNFTLDHMAIISKYIKIGANGKVFIDIKERTHKMNNQIRLIGVGLFLTSTVFVFFYMLFGNMNTTNSLEAINTILSVIMLCVFSIILIFISDEAVKAGYFKEKYEEKCKREEDK